MNQKPTLFMAIYALFLIAGCGSSHNNTARAVINGQSFEMGVQGVDCWAGPVSGGVVAGYDGAMDTPVVCKINFRSMTVISDYLMITANSVVSIYRDFLETWIPLTPGLVWAELSFQGLPETIYSGQIAFDNISNYAGDTVCASYEFQTGNGMVEGQFCGEVREGF